MKTADKRERIRQAAADVFFELGFQRATTQEIADRAGVGTGTVFRYAATKAELLLWVGRELLDVPAPSSDAEPLQRTVMRVVSPLLEFAVGYPENFVAYQREMMFGPAGKYREDAVRGITMMERTIGQALAADVGGLPDGLSAEEAGRSFLSMIFVELIRVCMHVETRADVEAIVPARLQLFRDGLAAQRP